MRMRYRVTARTGHNSPINRARDYSAHPSREKWKESGKGSEFGRTAEPKIIFLR
jgi:hypothetical protein